MELVFPLNPILIFEAKLNLQKEIAKNFEDLLHEIVSLNENEGKEYKVQKTKEKKRQERKKKTRPEEKEEND